MNKKIKELEAKIKILESEIELLKANKQSSFPQPVPFPNPRPHFILPECEPYYSLMSKDEQTTGGTKYNENKPYFAE